MSNREFDSPLHVGLAVFTYCCLDRLLAGYAGGDFALRCIAHALAVALPFLAWGAGLALLRRNAGVAPFSESLAFGALGALIGATFLPEWVDAWSGLAAWFPGSWATRSVLGFLAAAVFASFPLCAAYIGSGGRMECSGAWSLFAPLVLAPRVALAFDHVDSGARIQVAVAIAVAAALLGVVVWLFARATTVGLRNRAAIGLAMLAAVLCFAVPGPQGEAAAPPSIIVVLVDTLRADRLGADPAVARMPKLYARAEDGVIFEQAIAPSPWTLPSSMSLVSAMNPHRHLVGRSAGDLAIPGRPEASFLASSLRQRGYATAAFVNNPYLRPYYGFGRDFLHFRRYQGRADDGLELALDWLAAESAGPVFLLLHLMDPHWPYEAPARFDRDRSDCVACDSLLTAQYSQTDETTRRELRRRYDAEVAYTDDAIDRLLGRLAQRGVLDNSWVFVTSDHGEELWEHEGFLHGHSLFDEQLRVPLLVLPPRSETWARGRRVWSQVRLEDVGATFLDLAGVEVEAAGERPPSEEALAGLGDATLAAARLEQMALRPVIDGRSLLAQLGAASPAEDQSRAVVAGYLKSPVDLRFAVRTSHTKFVSGQEREAEGQIFDLRTDPGERKNGLAGGGDVAAQRFLKQAQALIEQSGLRPGDRRPLSAAGLDLSLDVQAELRALGYLD